LSSWFLSPYPYFCHGHAADMNLKTSVALLLFAMAVSAIKPFEYLTWFLEVFPIIIAIPFMIWFGGKGKISPLLFLFITIHGIVLAIGGHYTYANVPMGNWLVDIGLFQRNNYDKLGHFMQGFVPAMVLNEILIRTGMTAGHARLSKTIIVLSCAGISAVYEIIEWLAAVALGSGADEFLGTQGYVWDTQSDMLMAIIGALCMVFTYGRIHERSINQRLEN
jgi:putative membrane protein